jgi:hypothetical protein
MAIKKKEKEVAPKGKKELTQEELEMAAYYKWLERGCPHGDPMADWIEAEKHLKGK